MSFYSSRTIGVVRTDMLLSSKKKPLNTMLPLPLRFLQSGYFGCYGLRVFSIHIPMKCYLSYNIILIFVNIF